ncbi:MAG: antibiotic biosynthesis monooxygenase [Sporomusaceae bacterium]|nr:antibiotic biosynthesis monooxygenase [Sporomusaceae bacterium]
MSSRIAKTPEAPYYAVIFTSVMSDQDLDSYNRIGDELIKAVEGQPGFLGIESVRDASGVGITVSYWDSLEAIEQWKNDQKHLVAQKKGSEVWYKNFATRICKVERNGLFK